MKFRVRVEGARELRRELQRLSDRNGMRRAMRGVHIEVAHLVSGQATREAPRKSGRLASTVKGTATETKAVVQAGTGKRVPYAGPVHFGAPATRAKNPKNIKPNRFIYRAMARRYEETRRAFRDAVYRVLRNIDSR
ncbi:hypothetical protein GCM10012275_56340 [Longimycelium tulufanense]|uniref:HK97 gp10 family phage protein n=1 Tax=Longimycelium tulufanense TaxID=907463 RepID=A0A8J3CKR1_9PSEU|nr:hypothetical protein [Longimycelium tulufanense]GGM78456.1 hypothetical protein GCM10012275_56340 [Longimycelium tulufanense]